MERHEPSVEDLRVLAQSLSGLAVDRPAASPDPLLRDWLRQLHTMHVAHRRAESRAARLSRSVGLAIAVVSAVTGTAIFATLQQDPRTGWRVAVGVIAIAGAILGALQSTMAFGQQQAQHRSAAEGYGVLRRELEDWMIAHPRGDAAAFDAWAADLRRRWNATEAGAPALSNRLYRQAERAVHERERR